MKEIGIIMSGNHPKLILDGTKTMTRRVIKLKGYSREIWKSCVPHNGKVAELLGEPYLKVPYDPFTDNAGTRITCPHGQVGDRLIIKETWAAEKRYDHLKPSDIPDTAKIYYIDKNIRKSGGYSLFSEIGKTRSAMFMCLWMSRARPEITEVRAERVQKITEEDAIAEGVESREEEWVYQEANGNKHTLDFTTPEYKRYDHKGDGWTREPRLSFLTLWDSLNAKRGYGWEKNPWVWVLFFKLERRGK